MTKSALDRILILIAGAFALAVFVCILAVFGALFSVNGTLLGHFFEFLFPRYMKATVILVASVCLICAFLGTTLAFLVANFSFFGSRFLDVLLMLPLAIPAYILAFIYVGIMDYDGIFVELFGFRFDIFNEFGAILVLSLSLYPYVYMFARASFASEGGAIFDVAQILGLSKFKAFYRIFIFISRPAIISGLMLVLMECLSDYGTAAYFGVDTFSAGIFKLWFDLQDLGSSSVLSCILIVFIFGIMLLEYRLSWAKKYSLNSDCSVNRAKFKLQGWRAWCAFLYCAVVAFLGFVLPFSWLSFWAFKSHLLFDFNFYSLAGNSLCVALLSAFIITAVAFFLNFCARICGAGFMRVLILKCSSIGYAMPGAVIGVSLMIVFMGVSNLLNIPLLSVSIWVLIAGYLLRYLATAMLSIESGYHKLHTSLDESSRIMGLGRWRLALKIHAPLLRHFFTLSFIVVFVDVVKELPLSLILRPFDFETLSIRAFFYATDERIYDAALPAFLIVFISLVALLYIELRRGK